ncbi:NADH-quinone oxidoreductase subunit C [Aestuariimicrobium sp. p3-SID1156]|uniref:NADH-quinone oxidoreductase subunit C n=1 Tax=Aestuariimicrobium sp. p3-SID1156 TaxID=2916038 RepID=UPI00223BAD1F|nr:NADH-quinone oxidoreductase subunit C [Aestuariimicrobium sp. p3-SID1156]MCT1458786.1 NADH-quinone oxidoreductase subunit C [Aestuariimicrobium sp. p3-SID1156]
MSSLVAGGVGPGMGPDDEVREVPAAEWVSGVSGALAEGFTWFDSLHAVDEFGRPHPELGEHFRVLCRLVRWGEQGPAGLQLHTRIAREDPILPSLGEIIPGATWHEREAHDFFGITFTGGDSRPLLVHQAAGVAEPLRPLRKDVVLAARVTRPWPGARDPEADSGAGRAQASRRRMAPAGVPDLDLWGARAEGDPAPADEVVQALQGGRVRRRR